MDGCFIKGKIISLRIGTNPLLESGDNTLCLNVRFHLFFGEHL